MTHADQPSTTRPAAARTAVSPDSGRRRLGDQSTHQDQINQDRLRQDGRPVAYRSAGSAISLLVYAGRDDELGPVLMFATADPDGHVFDLSPVGHPRPSLRRRAARGVRPVARPAGAPHHAAGVLSAGG